MITLTCEHCHRPFEVMPSRARRFCGVACSSAASKGIRREGVALRGEDHGSWKGGPVESACAQCGIKVTRKRGLFSRREHVFCSRKCHGLWRSEHSRGSDNPAWCGGTTPYRKRDMKLVKWAIAIKARAGGRCELCGTTQSLEAHHLLPYSTHPAGRYDLDNGQCLCRACHKKLPIPHIIDPATTQHPALPSAVQRPPLGTEQGARQDADQPETRLSETCTES